MDFLQNYRKVPYFSDKIIVKQIIECDCLFMTQINTELQYSLKGYLTVEVGSLVDIANHELFNEVLAMQLMFQIPRGA